MWDNHKQNSFPYIWKANIWKSQQSNNVKLSKIYYFWHIWYTGHFSEQKAKIRYESHISNICQEIIIFKFWILDKAFVKYL